LPIDDRKPEYLSVDQQIDIWRESIVDNGLKITEFSVVDAVWHMSRQEIINFIPVPVGFYKTFIKAGQPFDGKRLTDAVFDALINPGADQPNPNAWKEFLANESITKIIQNTLQSYDLVVDLGPGDGSLTKVLSTYVKHKRIVALDVDPIMISHSKHNNSVDSIEYELQDLSVGWDQFRSDLKRQLEGKVELIFSNFVLHFIPNKKQLLNVVSRLLATNGTINANLIVIADINKKLSSNDRKAEYLSVEQQTDIWRDSIAANGLTVKEFNVVDSVWHLNRQEMIDFIPVLVGHYKTFLKEDQPFDGKLIIDAVFDSYINPGAVQPNPNAWKEFLANDNITKLNLYKDHGCVAYMDENFNEILSPNYPNVYPLNARCFWYITVPNDKYIGLKINTFKTETKHDFVSIYDGHSEKDSPLMGTYSGIAENYDYLGIPRPGFSKFKSVISSGNKVLVKFQSDAMIGGTGFNITYEVMDQGCGITLNESHYEIVSPGYPNDYIFALVCVWNISVAQDMMLMITFNDFETEDQYDYLQIHDGIEGNSSYITYTGHNKELYEALTDNRDVKQYSENPLVYISLTLNSILVVVIIILVYRQQSSVANDRIENSIITIGNAM
ncbi:unnamed protein product, partial [Oppiella nova]